MPKKNVVAHEIWRRNKKKFVKKSFSLANIEPKRVLIDFTPKNQLLIEKVFFQQSNQKIFFRKVVIQIISDISVKKFRFQRKKIFFDFFSLVPQAKKKFFFF